MHSPTDNSNNHSNHSHNHNDETLSLINHDHHHQQSTQQHSTTTTTTTAAVYPLLTNNDNDTMDNENNNNNNNNNNYYEHHDMIHDDINSDINSSSSSTDTSDNSHEKTKKKPSSLLKKALRLNKIILLFITLVISIIAYAIMDESEHSNMERYHAISGAVDTCITLYSHSSSSSKSSKSSSKQQSMHYILFKAKALEVPSTSTSSSSLLQINVIYRVKVPLDKNDTLDNSNIIMNSDMSDNSDNGDVSGEVMKVMMNMNSDSDSSDSEEYQWIQIANVTMDMQNSHMENETVLVEHLFETPKHYLPTTKSSSSSSKSPIEYQLVIRGNNNWNPSDESPSSSIATQFTISFHSRLFASRIWIALLILIFIYVLIIFELVHRTVATILGAFMSVSALSILNLKPSVHTLVHWIEFHTLFLLFGMMVMVAIMSQTGFFEYMALKAYRLSQGHLWRLVLILSIIVAVTSSMLDNVTSMLLLTPVIIRLCRVMDISPVPTLIATVVVSNIGGCATAVGDPPVTLIVNTPAIRDSGIGFNEILFFMAPGTVIMLIVSLFFIRFIYWKEFSLGSGGNSDNGTDLTRSLAPHLAQLKNEIEIWSQTAARLSKHVQEEYQLKQKLNQHVKQLEKEFREKRSNKSGGGGEGHGGAEGDADDDDDMVDIAQLEKEYVIRNKPKFIMCFAVMLFVVFMFFLETFISDWVHLSLDSIAIVGALLVIVLTDTVDFDHILEKVEWSSLLFFATLFIMMGSLDEMGLIGYVGDVVTALILKVDEKWRLAFAITVIIWLSSILSAIIDSIPYTTAMIPVVVAMRDTLDLPLKPLVFSLAYGSGLGGNGSIFASTANLVVANISEKFGHPISFMAFARCGVPIMLLCTFMANAYLLLVHCVFKLGLS